MCEISAGIDRTFLVLIYPVKCNKDMLKDVELLNHCLLTINFMIIMPQAILLHIYMYKFVRENGMCYHYKNY